MNVNLHIESIVLDGIELAPGDDRLLQQIVSRELTIMLSREGLGTLHRNGGEIGAVSGGAILLGATNATALGQQLAHSIHQGFTAPQNAAPQAAGGRE